MKFLRKLRALFRKESLETEMAEEMRAHLEQQTQANLARGMSADDARYAAQRSFGGVEQIKERARDQRGWVWLEQTLHDLRHATRQLTKAPGFSATVILTLGLGIGACAGVYSVVDGLLLHPIGHDPHPEHELRLFETKLPGLTESRVSPADFLDWQKLATSFSSIRAGAGADLTLTGAGEPVRLTAARATAQLLEVHGWPVALGRGFLPEEDIPGHDKVIIISYQIWQRCLGGDPAALGRPLQINGEPYTVVGIISEEVGRFSNADAFVPMALTAQERTQRGNRSLGVWARLKPGVTLEQARAEMNVIAAQLAQQHPDTNQGWGASLITVVQIQGGGGLREALWTLLGAVGCVLLIACANAANLLLARATVRQREMAVRAALGAGRLRLLRQLLTESLLLALLGGAAGVLLAHWGLQAVHAYAGPGMQRLGYVELNRGMLAWALALSVATGLVFGLAPAWFSARVDLHEALKSGARGVTDGPSRGRLRGALVVVEVALAIVLLAAAAGLVRRLVERTHLDPGFVPENVAALQLSLSRQKYAKPGAQVDFAEAVLARIREVPGVEVAGATTSLPLPQSGRRFETDGRPARPTAEWPLANTYGITPDYFSAMRIRLKRGRAFSAQDDIGASRVAIVNETLARQYFPGEDPVGRRIRFDGTGSDRWREIIAVAGDVTQFGAATEVMPQVYEPFAQSPGLNLSFVVRSSGGPPALLSLLKPQIYAVDQDQPVTFVRPLEELLDDRIAGQRFAMHLLVAFSFVALVIAAVGIYAVIAFDVSRRTTEIGIRMALGARAGDVLRLVLVHGARVVGLGLLIGIGAAFAAGRTIKSMLYQVDARDPVTLAAVAVLLAGVAAVACLFPARRAAKVDPMIALRCE